MLPRGSQPFEGLGTEKERRHAYHDNAAGIEAESTQILKIDVESTQNRPSIDPEFAENRPRTFGEPLGIPLGDPSRRSPPGTPQGDLPGGWVDSEYPWDIPRMVPQDLPPV